MQALYDVPAPAKLNLFLHITGRRSDGYHLLQSVFMLIDWCDTLHFELRPHAGLSREDLGPALPANDLVLRAARALQAASGTRLGAHIAVDKQIPAQAGMGGGSSDAASCLLALNRLWRLRLSLPQLEKIGLQLGADVPFFLRGHNAWVEGVGELITPLPADAQPAPAQILVLKPEENCATADIFSAVDLKRNTNTATIRGFAERAYGFGHNDLQAVVQRLCPGVGQALGWFAAQGLEARMTGSGSAVFAVLPPGFDASAKVFEPALPPAWTLRKCRNLPLHPLLGWADG